MRSTCSYYSTKLMVRFHKNSHCHSTSLRNSKKEHSLTVTYPLYFCIHDLFDVLYTFNDAALIILIEVLYPKAGIIFLCSKPTSFMFIKLLQSSWNQHLEWGGDQLVVFELLKYIRRSLTSTMKNDYGVDCFLIFYTILIYFSFTKCPIFKG